MPFFAQWILFSLLSLSIFLLFGTQLAFTYSKLTTATLDQVVKYVQSQQLKHQANSVVLVSLLLTLNKFFTLI